MPRSKNTKRSLAVKTVVFVTPGDAAEIIENIVTQTHSRTTFDFVTFSAAPRRADIHALRSIRHSGLSFAVRCGLND